MKLRVKQYAPGWWTVQRLWLGFFWVSVKKSSIWDGDRFMSSRRFPLLYRSFQEAESMAHRLVQPGAMEKHEAEQAAKWANAKLGFAAARVAGKKVKVISS